MHFSHSTFPTSTVILTFLSTTSFTRSRFLPYGSHQHFSFCYNYHKCQSNSVQAEHFQHLLSSCASHHFFFPPSAKISSIIIKVRLYFLVPNRRIFSSSERREATFPDPLPLYTEGEDIPNDRQRKYRPRETLTIIWHS